MDTIEAGRFEDTNKVFERPESVDYIITKWKDRTDLVLAPIIEKEYSLWLKSQS